MASNFGIKLGMAFSLFALSIFFALFIIYGKDKVMQLVTNFNPVGLKKFIVPSDNKLQKSNNSNNSFNNSNNSN